MKQQRVTYLYYILLVILYYVAEGYLFGRSDQLEIIPYAQHLLDANAFKFDFYVQQMIGATINERTVIVQLFKILGNHPWLIFGCHILLVFFLIRGFFKIGDELHFERHWTVLVFLAYLLLGSRINLAGNDLFYNFVIGSSVAKVFGIWSIYYFLKDRQLLVWILILLATLFQSIVGLQLALILGIVTLWQEKSLAFVFKTGAIIPIALLLSWIYFLLSQTGASDSNISYYEFLSLRTPHHYLPSHFTAKNFLYTGGLLLLGLSYFREDKKVIKIYIITILFVVLYTIGVMLLKNDQLIKTQFYKALIWLELLSLFALVGIGKKWLSQMSYQKYLPYIGMLFVLAIAVIKPPFDNDFPWVAHKTDDIPNEIDPNSIFLIHSDLTPLKIKYQWSSYFDFKTVPFSQNGIHSWLSRASDLYGVDPNAERKGFPYLRHKEKEFYENFDDSTVQKLKSLSINYLVAPTNIDLPLRSIHTKDNWVIYPL